MRIIDAHLRFCEGVKWYKDVIYAFTKESDEKTEQLFAHFLDCEAHTDVWREMFPTWNQTNKFEDTKKL